MARQGEYVVNSPAPVKDTSFRSFICALLVFLALCILIYLILAFTQTAKKDKEADKNIISEKDVVVFENRGGWEKEKIRVPDTAEKENERTMDHNSATDIPDIDETSNEIEDESATKSQEIVKFLPYTKEVESTTHLFRQKESDEATTILSGKEMEDESTTEVEGFKKFLRYRTRMESTTSMLQQTESDQSSNESTSPGPMATITEEIIIPTKINITGTSGKKTQQSTQTPTETDINTSTSTEDNSFETTEQSETVDLGYDHNLFHNGYLTTTGISEETTEMPESTTTLIATPVYRQVSKTSNSTRENIMTTAEEADVISTTEAFSTTRQKLNVFKPTTDGTDTNTTPESLSTTRTAGLLNPKITTEEVDGSSTTEKLEVASTTADQSTTLARQSIFNSVPSTTEDNFESTTLLTGHQFVKANGTTEDDTTSTSTTEEAELGSTTIKQLSTTEVNVASTTTDNLNVTTAEAYTSTTTKRPLQSSQPLKLIPQSAVPPPPPPTCNTNRCKRAASRLLYLMNHDQDPCEDFYDFACGGHQIDEEVTNTENMKFLINYLNEINGASDKYLLDFKKFYESCLYHEQNFLFSERIAFLYDMPNLNLTELFVELILNQSMPLFDIGLDIEENTKTYIYELILPRKSSLMVNIQGWSLLEQIKNECLNNLQLAGTDVNLDLEYESLRDCQNVTLYSISENFIKEMNLMRQFPAPYDNIYTKENLDKLVGIIRHIRDAEDAEYEIREIMVSREHGYSNIGSLTSTTGYDKVDWVAIFQKLTFHGVVNENRDINVYLKTYFVNLLRKLQNFSEREVIDMLWLYSRLQLYFNTVVPKAKANIEMHCMTLTKQLMPDIVSSIIYEKFKQKNMYGAVYNVRTLFDKLKDKLDKSITNSTMDEESRKLFKAKLNSINLGLITTGDQTAIKSNNKYVTLQENNFQANVVALLRNYKRTVYSLEGTNTTAATLLQYFVDPFDPLPKSFYTSRYIAIQPAFLERVAQVLPDYIKLATIGMDLSKELTKHFDPIGRTIRNAPETKTLSDDYYKELKQRTRNMLDMYANYTYTIQGSVVTFQVNQSMWINQMIADNAAFRIVFDSFNELNGQDNFPWMYYDYTVEKVFFVAAAQEFCGRYRPVDFLRDTYMSGNLPPPLQIQNFISNTEQFADIFECPTGSAMTIYEDMITQFPHIDFTGHDYDYNTPSA